MTNITADTITPPRGSRTDSNQDKSATEPDLLARHRAMKAMEARALAKLDSNDRMFAPDR